jgi:hypothetical protein
MTTEKPNKEIDNTDKYNIIMPETTDRVLCIRVEKPISGAGYAGNFAPRIHTMLKLYGGIRLLVYYKEYHGWEAEAALMDMGGLAEFGNKVVKFAMVNPPKRELVRLNVKKSLLSGENKVFDEKDLAEALRWVAE